MKAEKAEAIFKLHRAQDEKSIGLFYASFHKGIGVAIFDMGLTYFLSGKKYYIAVTDKGLHIMRLGFGGKLRDLQFYPYAQIANVRYWGGILGCRLKFRFTDGTSLIVNAARRGFSTAPKLDDELFWYLKDTLKF